MIMKKKVFLAVLVMCTILAAGCGNDSAEKEENTKTEAASDKEDSKKNTEEETRLVSVKDIDKYITIGEYKGISLEKTVQEITDDDVEIQIGYELKNMAEPVTDENTEAQNGDIVTIDYVGTENGVEFSGGTGSDYELTLGDGMMVPGFEDGIVGMKTGEIRDVSLTFPEDYYPEMAGKAVVFQITLKKLSQVPELTDEWVASNTEYANVEEYRQGIRGQMEQSAEQSAMYNLYSAGWSAVLDNSEIIEFPEKEINACIEEFKKQVQIYADQAGMKLEEFVEAQGYTQEAFEEECQQYAEYKVKQNLIIQGIMDAEGISLSDPECLEIQNQIIADYGAKDLADLIDIYGQVAVDETIGLIRVEQFIVENAKVANQVTNGGLTGVDGDKDVAGEVPADGASGAETESEEPADGAEEPDESDADTAEIEE